MKKIFSLALVSLMVLGMTQVSSFAATSSTPAITTTAVVPSNLVLNLTMKRNDYLGSTIAAMNFGNLVDIGTGTLRSSPTSTTGTGAVAAFITGSASGLPYSITQSGTAMSDGASHTLPGGALVVKAVYNAADNSSLTLPTGATTPTSAGATWTTSQTLYTSGPTGAARTVTAFYSVTDNPTDGSTAAIPLSQPAGTYTGSVTFTITA